MIVGRFIPAHAGNSKHRSNQNRARSRFIPAHAGNRLSIAADNAALTVHPRARGEQADRG